MVQQRVHKIAVLIPCYNEASTIAKVVKDFSKALPEANIYVYDNNSSDNSVAIARRAGAIVRHEYRQGKGNVVRSQFREIEADAYLMVDGDDTYPAENAREMVDLILSGRADMVIGDRLSSTYFEQENRLTHQLGNKVVRDSINFIFKSNVRDIMTGYRTFSRDFVKTFPVVSGGFEIETQMTIHTLDKNLKWVEIPVQYRDRPEGSESKLNTVSDGIKVLATIFNLTREYRPMLFFNTFAVLALAIGVTGITIPVAEFTKTGEVERFPTLIVGATFLLIAILLWMAGLICDLIAKKFREEFEVQINQARGKQ
jgi:glycosyltransferase involved in cell wall biosynthesis